MLQDYALLFNQFHMLPSLHVVMSRAYTLVCVASYSRNHGRISPEKMPFVVEERGKENVVPVRLLSRERLVCISVA